MSYSSAPDPLNPYSAGHNPSVFSPQGAQSSSLPMFVKVIMIMDLVFCGIRLVLALVGLVGYAVLKQQNSPLAESVIAEVATGFGVAAFGIAGNSLILMRKNWAAALAGICVLFTLGSLGVGIWQASMQLDIQAGQFPPGSPERMGFYIGAGGMVVIRLVLIGLYVAAICQFLIWCRRQPTRRVLF